MLFRLPIATLFLSLVAAAAWADFQAVKDQNEFLSHVGGKTLTRPFVELQVTRDGRISGMGARWEVTGEWTWRDGFFCRGLEWGGDDLGYNCQEVRVNGDRIRFTSDKGTGRSAEFRLN